MSLCGQYCIARIAKVSLSEAIEIVGHSKNRGTTTKEIILALDKLKIPHSPRLRKIKKSSCLPENCLISLRHREIKNLYHWTVNLNNKIYDPGLMDSIERENWKTTSYLELWPPD